MVLSGQDLAMGSAKPSAKRPVAPLSPTRSVACRSTKSLLTKRTLHKTTGSWTKRLNVPCLADQEESVGPLSSRSLSTDQLLDLLKRTNNAANLSQCLMALERTLKIRDLQINSRIIRLDGYQILAKVFRRLARQLHIYYAAIVKIISIFRWMYKSDKRFNVMFRTCGALKILSSCLQCLILGHPKTYQSAGELLLLCCKSNGSVQILWRSGSIISIIQSWSSVPFSRLPCLLHLILTITNSIADKSIANRSFMAKALTKVLLQLIRLSWNTKLQDKSAIMKSLLNCIQKLLKSKSARNTFHQQQALSFIQEICRTTLSLELFQAGAAVLLAAFPPKKLPLSSMSHPLVLQGFRLADSIKNPDSNPKPQESCSIGINPSADVQSHPKEVKATLLKQEKHPSTGQESDCQQINHQSHPPVNLALYTKYFPELCSHFTAELTGRLCSLNSPSSQKHFESASDERSQSFQLNIGADTRSNSSRSHTLPESSLSDANNKVSPLPILSKKGVQLSAGQPIVTCPNSAICQENGGSKVSLPLSSESFFPYQRIAHPDMVLFDCLKTPKPTLLLEAMAPSTKLEERRKILWDEVAQLLEPSASGFIKFVVYDAEVIVRHLFALKAHNLKSQDLQEEIDRMDSTLWPHHDHSLTFDSLFESGNLRKAIQVGRKEYDLLLFADINRSTCGQWFYFRVSKMLANIAYRFNIINCQKANSFFGDGMQPVVFSVKDATASLPHGLNGGWKRKGTNIAYYRNNYKGHGFAKMQGEESCRAHWAHFYTLTFTLKFDHDDDMVYVAYHYPYTYTTLQRRLKGWQEKSRTLSGLFFLSHKLTRTLGGLALPLLTITGSSSFCETSSQVKCKKELVVLTGRVHPSESNASYVIDGILESLLNESVTSKSLLQNFVFKIIPMLNPDGVVCGNWRCSLAGLDLNRQWADPAAYIVPTIFHAKNLMEGWKRMGRRVYLYVDCHGHSNEKNVFFYGCSPLTNWHQPNWDNGAECIINLGQPKHKPVLDNTTIQHFVKMDIAAKSLPLTMKDLSGRISLRHCSYDVQESREGCARITVWREFACVRSYTLESSIFGFDSGPFQGYQMAIGHSHQTGQDLIGAIYRTWKSSELDDCFSAPLAL